MDKTLTIRLALKSAYLLRILQVSQKKKIITINFDYLYLLISIFLNFILLLRYLCYLREPSKNDDV